MKSSIQFSPGLRAVTAAADAVAAAPGAGVEGVDHWVAGVAGAAGLLASCSMASILSIASALSMRGKTPGFPIRVPGLVVPIAARQFDLAQHTRLPKQFPNFFRGRGNHRMREHGNNPQRFRGRVENRVQLRAGVPDLASVHGFSP